MGKWRSYQCVHVCMQFRSGADRVAFPYSDSSALGFWWRHLAANRATDHHALCADLSADENDGLDCSGGQDAFPVRHCALLLHAAAPFLGTHGHQAIPQVGKEHPVADVCG